MPSIQTLIPSNPSANIPSIQTLIPSNPCSPCKEKRNEDWKEIWQRQSHMERRQQQSYSVLKNWHPAGKQNKSRQAQWLVSQNQSPSDHDWISFKIRREKIVNNQTRVKDFILQ